MANESPTLLQRIGGICQFMVAIVSEICVYLWSIYESRNLYWAKAEIRPSSIIRVLVLVVCCLSIIYFAIITRYTSVSCALLRTTQAHPNRMSHRSSQHAPNSYLNFFVSFWSMNVLLPIKLV